MKSVSIIIVTYNAEKYIYNCVSSINESKINVHIIVIDNGSQDKTLDIIRANFKNIEIVDSKKNLGFGAANNIGYEIALARNSDYIYLLNQDTISYPETLSRMIEILDSDSHIGVASPMHLNDDGQKLDKKFEEYISAGSCPEYISDASLNKVSTFYEIGFVNAAAWLINIEMIKKLGGLFSSAFFHYGEDSNFLSRLRYHKKKCVIIPNIYVHHLREERSGKMSAAFEKRKLSIKKVEIMTNINRDYKSTVKILYKYAGQQIFHGNLKGGFELLLYPITHRTEILRYRNSYTSSKIL
ncbi:glycosyltransferase family 2 protein [Epilithonimonas zeae]|uniref:Glycosyltransferase, GT2 family n=1 Tax=Epilithonimonas zeae TaxID=1416779 RepID=A0A1N6J5H6_9FLAO|nr:glycosyltransferase family 2 protein [Epilithonimonas zeae]SIO39409.1 Glycosyltransferase, GT2 family [Epilithonimonas zeae]